LIRINGCHQVLRIMAKKAMPWAVCLQAGTEAFAFTFERKGRVMKRTTHRSVTGTKLYAVRDSKGRFKDIQTYKRAHAQDLKRRSKAEGPMKPPV
jgi:hypothetical protein